MCHCIFQDWNINLFEVFLQSSLPCKYAMPHQLFVMQISMIKQEQLRIIMAFIIMHTFIVQETNVSVYFDNDGSDDDWLDCVN